MIKMLHTEQFNGLGCDHLIKEFAYTAYIVEILFVRVAVPERMLKLSIS